MVRKLKTYLLFFIFFLAQNSYANLPLIRDAETERFLHDLSDPIFKAAGLDANNIKIYLVNDDSINAFVSGGQNVFVNIGLIRKYNTPDTLIGVLAHETGHISAGHLVRSYESAQAAEKTMLLSYLLGIGAAVSGSPDAAQGLIFGGSDTAQRLYMKFTRNQEEAADKYAILYLDKLAYPADGLVKLLEFFDSEMIGYKGQIDEYLLSHPVSKKRIDLIKYHTKNKKYSDAQINSRLQNRMDFVLAKLEGFIDDPNLILEKYRNSNDKFSNYKKAIAFAHIGNLDRSSKLLDDIIKNEAAQNLGFLYETKGQLLFEGGDVVGSIVAYDKAAKFLNERDGALAKISFASSILTLRKEDDALIKLAITRLEEAKKVEDENPFLFRELAKAYDKINNKPKSDLNFAEFYFLSGQNSKAMEYAKSAKNGLPKSDKKNLIRIDDLLALIKEEKKKNNDVSSPSN